MIIVTGMDNTGKTTLAKQISEELKISLVNSPGPIPGPKQMEWVMKALEFEFNKKGNGKPTTVYERFPIFEEMVYGPIIRGDSNFSTSDMITSILKLVDPLIIYTRPHKDNIFNFGDREQMTGVIEHKEKLLSAYDELMFNLMTNGWRVLVYNYETSKIASVVTRYEIIRRHMKEDI